MPLGGAGAVTRDIEIPAGDDRVLISATRTIAEWRRRGTPEEGSDGGDDDEAWALGVAAHGHLLMKAHRLTLNAGTADERILLDIPRWDFHWQGQWLYQEPIAVRASDTLTIDCTYDNSEEHRAAVGLDPVSGRSRGAREPPTRCAWARLRWSRPDPSSPARVRPGVSFRAGRGTARRGR